MQKKRFSFFFFHFIFLSLVIVLHSTLSGTFDISSIKEIFICKQTWEMQVNVLNVNKKNNL